MPDLYHGTKSEELFSTPDPSKIVNESRYGTNEYGWGFYTTDYAGDAWEHIGGDWGRPEGIVYSTHVPDDVFRNNFLHAGQPIGQATYDRLVIAANKNPEFKEALKGISATSNGSQVANIAKGFNGAPSPKEGAIFLAQAGIQGYQEGSYVVFYDPEKVKLEPYGAIGDRYQTLIDNREKTAPNAHSNDAKPAATGSPSTSTASGTPIPSQHKQPPVTSELNNIGQSYVQNGMIASEVLEHSIYELRQLGDPQLLEKFQPILDQLHIGPYSQGSNNSGFAAREKIGYAIQRGLSGENFGTTPANLGETLRGLGVKDNDPKLYNDLMNFFERDLAPHMKPPYAPAGAPAVSAGIAGKASGFVARSLGALGVAAPLLHGAADLAETQGKAKQLLDKGKIVLQPGQTREDFLIELRGISLPASMNGQYRGLTSGPLPSDDVLRAFADKYHLSPEAQHELLQLPLPPSASLPQTTNGNPRTYAELKLVPKEPPQTNALQTPTKPLAKRPSSALHPVV